MDLFIGGLTIIVVLLVITGLTLLIDKFRENKLKIKQKNWWLITHIIFMFFGVCISSSLKNKTQEQCCAMIL
ncbi:hypothetical protein [Desulfoscipio gibsoniae]|uniref:Uncharacterized protein n=1 Tax=Desulfoscipio gibsoniae DSM 7213 TaxID=767817 RepID=R4KDT7_9FIRM|nr:hypothetical protein [Desulfoscipio gibsoniae]AGL00749.1 hypothetical protein Desgi_1228 [Desulfoscipio gibsoniae DSM 7213]